MITKSLNFFGTDQFNPGSGFSAKNLTVMLAIFTIAYFCFGQAEFSRETEFIHNCSQVDREGLVTPNKINRNFVIDCIYLPIR